MVTGHGGRRRLAALAAGVSLLAAACGGTAHQQAAPPTTQQTLVTATPSYQWSRVSSPALDIGGGSSTIADVLAPVAAGQQWIAVGARPAPAASPSGAPAGGGSPTATVWTSPDAIHWTATDLPVIGGEAAAGAGGQLSPSAPPVSQARSVARLGSTVIVVGSSGVGAAQRAAVWISRGPGRPWQAVPGGIGSVFSATPLAQVSGTATSPGSGAGAVMDHVATGAIGAFAVGTIRGATAMWYSSDATKWTRLTSAEKVIDSSDQPHINALLVAANGVWAAGSVVQGTDTEAAVWRSTDGIHWSRITSATRSFTGNGDHVINALAPLGSGFVAVGAVRSGARWLPASWISPDGVSWSGASSAFPLSPPGGGGRGGTEANAVATVQGAIYAVGGSSSTQRLWKSTDGLSWKEVPLPPGAATSTGLRLGLVAARGGTTVIADDDVGQPRLLTDKRGSWTEVSADPAVFGAPAPVATPTSLVASGGRLYLSVDVRIPGQALGHSTSSAAVLSSPNGTDWTLDSRGGPLSGHQIRSLMAVPGGLEAVGGASGAGSAAMWSSSNGKTWVAASGASSTIFGGSNDPALARAVTRVGSTLVATGNKGSTAVAWTSPGQGSPWQPPAALDANQALATETPLAACAGPQAVVAVGRADVGAPGSQAEAWISTDGQTWKPATVTPAATPGEQETMTGCLTTGNAFMAYGAAAGPKGTLDPAVWQSTDGTSWTRQPVAAFTGQGDGPITDLALRGTTWLAVSGGDAAQAEADRASSTITIWRSQDAGRTWQQLHTSSAPWDSGLYSSSELVGFAGGEAVVVGQVDGGLAVWAGAPHASSGTGNPTGQAPPKS